MDKLQELMIESLNEADSRYKKESIKKIYDNVNAKRLTSKKFSDNSWKGVDEILGAIRSTTPYVDKVDVSLTGTGYHTYGDTQSKEYNLKVTLSDSSVLAGLITCHAAGTVSDIWKSYDMTLQLW